MSWFHLIRPLLFRLPAETAHHWAIAALRHHCVPTVTLPPYPRLEQAWFGHALPHPFGLAAGFDKNAVAIEPILHQGVSFMEVGTLTRFPQAGNRKPRLFRLTQDKAIINRMGFNNRGVEEALPSLARPRSGMVGVNIGFNKDSTTPLDDLRWCYDQVYPYADYIVINISSPNTPGLRAWQEAKPLETLLKHFSGPIQDSSKPLLWKLSPDIDDRALRDIGALAIDYRVHGLILTNTTLMRPPLQSPHQTEQGGLSGAPLKGLSTEIIGKLYTATQGNIPIIGVGGISSAADAYQKIRAGASLCQVYTGFIYHGFSALKDWCRDLDRLLAEDGFASITEAIGVDSPLS